MSLPKSAKLSNPILDEATRWVVEFNEGSLSRAAREEFAVWLRTSPEHVRAYLQVSSRLEEASALQKSRTHGVDELVAMARADEAIVSIERPTTGLFVGSRKSGASRRPGVGVVALAAMLLLVLGAGIGWIVLQRDLYVTGIGEQRSVAFEDGSTVELNSRSKVRVSFTDQQRNVNLLEGQALFRVAKDPSRPFIVYSGDTRVRAVGTQFDVYRKSHGIVVTVVEGRVAVLPDPAQPALYLNAGEQLTVSAASIAKPARPDIAAATAWTERQIVFLNTPLAEVVEEFNRYNTRQLVIATPGIETTQISGVFSSADSASILRGLESLGVFSIRQGLDRIEISAQPSAH